MGVIRALMEKWHFHIWNEENRLVRFVCSFDTLKEDVDRLSEGP